MEITVLVVGNFTPIPESSSGQALTFSPSRLRGVCIGNNRACVGTFTPIPESSSGQALTFSPSRLRGVCIGNNRACVGTFTPIPESSSGQALTFSPSRLRGVCIGNNHACGWQLHPHPNLPPSRGKGLKERIHGRFAFYLPLLACRGGRDLRRAFLGGLRFTCPCQPSKWKG